MQVREVVPTCSSKASVLMLRSFFRGVLQEPRDPCIRARAHTQTGQQGLAIVSLSLPPSLPIPSSRVHTQRNSIFTETAFNGGLQNGITGGWRISVLEKRVSAIANPN